jgi:formylglycine-generating enzyme required for sulfatase activity
MNKYTKRNLITVVSLAILLSFNFLTSAKEPQIEFIGIPERVKSVGFDLPCNKTLSRKEALKMKCVIHKVGDRYYWASKDNREVLKVAYGSFTNYICLNGLGYLKVTNPETRASIALMGETEAQFDYVEYDFLGLRAIVSYGKQTKKLILNSEGEASQYGLIDAENSLSDAEDSNMVFVQGGELPKASTFADTKIRSFYICPVEVTWEEWQNVQNWANSNGYDIGTYGKGYGSKHPVQSVNWYDALKWCNAKSEMSGLNPCYAIKTPQRKQFFYKSGELIPEFNHNANGYRLPTEAEWEWAALGGIKSKGFKYSGSNNIEEVAWHGGQLRSRNIDQATTNSVGKKAANELGIYDMSGNVWEWCWEFGSDKGGSYLAGTIGNLLEVLNCDSGPAHGRSPSGGFRIVRNFENYKSDKIKVSKPAHE